MRAAALAPHCTAPPSTRLDLQKQTGLALLCLCAAVAPLAARWIPDLATRITCGVLIAAGLLALSLASRRLTPLRQFRELSWALFVFAFVQVLNNSIPRYVATYALGE